MRLLFDLLWKKSFSRNLKLNKVNATYFSLSSRSCWLVSIKGGHKSTWKKKIQDALIRNLVTQFYGMRQAWALKQNIFWFEALSLRNKTYIFTLKRWFFIILQSYYYFEQKYAILSVLYNLSFSRILSIWLHNS